MRATWVVVALSACGGQAPESQPVEVPERYVELLLGTEQGEVHGAGGLATRGVGPAGSEAYTDHGVGGRVWVSQDPLSTFAIDVDTGSYTIVRKKLLQEGVLPPAAAVRVEEFVNYLPYSDPPPTDGAPVAVTLEAAPDPFVAGRHLLRVGLKAREITANDRRPVHLTFLVDVSGSMQGSDKLPLAQRALRHLVDHLGIEDTVGLVTYAGATRIALPPTPTTRRGDIHAAIDGLTAEGATAMASGLELAYGLAKDGFLPGCENRVVVLSDGDTNVGGTSIDAVLAEVKRYAGEGITLSTVGFGMGNYKDALMEQLADQGDGNYATIDTFDEAKRVFGTQLAGTLHTVARDVKLQVQFHPETVHAYRLLGYENRDIADSDFRNDARDAGELGSGQAVTALFELHLRDGPIATGPIATGPIATGPIATVRFRAKPSGVDAPADEWTTVIDRKEVHSEFPAASKNFRVAFGAATFAALLRNDPNVGELSLSGVSKLLRAAKRPGVPEDLELIALVDKAASLTP